MKANLQQQYCKVPNISIAANIIAMDGLESDTAIIKDLVKWTGLAPSALAKAAGLTPTTILRPFSGMAKDRLSIPTWEKLRARWPDFPGWRNEQPDQIGLLQHLVAMLAMIRHRHRRPELDGISHNN